MSLLDCALAFAKYGLPVFPVMARSKLPAVKGFPTVATTDPEKLKAWWTKNPNYNVGISTERLLVLDVDNKNGKHGEEELEKLTREHPLPETFEQSTPNGGRHLLFQVSEPVRQGADILGEGLDIRARGGYVVGAGSVIDAGQYKASPRPIQPAPAWLVERVGKARPAHLKVVEAVEGLDPERAAARAKRYLEDEAPLAVEGHHGDQTTFQVACRVKDAGVDAANCLELMAEHWNDRCEPPWEFSELARKVENAYAYGHSPVGAASPEAEFKVHPAVKKLNKEYAYVGGDKGFILHETTDSSGRFIAQHVDIGVFHQNLSPEKLIVQDKTIPLSKFWLSNPGRRTYDGICFMPGKEAPRRFYNLWRGFAVEPLEKGAAILSEWKASVDAFLQHAYENICVGDESLFKWLMGYFAHLIQRPWEKPGVALVMKGGKGVGKNALIERIGFLFGEHFAVVSNRRYLTGNFNSVLENKVLLTLDEAFWSGDKAAEGVIKDLITGEHHLIERKGKEPYRVRNCIRVVILGNEDWLAPASEDERRFAVFNVGDAKKQNREFFKHMRIGMEAGGYRLLLQHLQSIDLSAVDVTEAPKTIGLLEQKVESLSPFFQWWRDSLSQGHLIGLEFTEGWPVEISKSQFRSALYKELRDRNVRAWQPSYESVTKELKKCCPSAVIVQKRAGSAERVRVYRFPSLKKARDEWDAFIGHKTEWFDDEEEEDLFS